MEPTERGFRRLAAAVIIRAVKDVRRGLSCNGHCGQRSGHVCIDDAMTFLESAGCAALLEMLDLDPGKLPQVLQAAQNSG